ncbi:leucine-rich_repeat domain-containing protein [Hexamita inflata]|uniref:Leucine-rich repeat domain-containing protein n=1 Tax=Hexamita inflata TaxID=28002 RepID=A0AA86RIA6_9EUKA|nr:leucine-rich repeat domain-containing protein [Hexamita inflata]
MTLKYENKIYEGILQIGDRDRDYIDPEVTNLMFVEKFNIQTLMLCIRIDMYVNLRSNTIKELILGTQRFKGNKLLNLNLDDLELENLEVLDLENNNLVNDQLYNLTKFKKLNTLNVSWNKVGLMNIHSVTSITKLYMSKCDLKNIDLISSFVNLQELDLSKNTDLDLSPLCKVKSLKKLSMRECGLTNIDYITQLINLEVLNLAYNQLLTINSIGSLVNLKQLDISWNKKIDISPLKDLVGLIILNLRSCALTQLSALKPLTNLQDLDISHNSDIIITELQYLKNLKFLNLQYCNLVSVYVLRPLVNIEVLYIYDNNIVHLDTNLNEMKKLKTLRVESNRISDFKSIIKHPNYKNFDENCQKYLKIFNQTKPSKEEVRKAKQIIRIERQNLQLKEIPHKTHQTTFSNFKQEINAVLNNARQSQIQFTANVVRLFQQLNQFGLE